ncbi:uncharacterized protein [Leptinotarsa decemlineata]|uniref:uncharacterized protein n=1 Tax=Leptinotarsa decemlineata TaxID=7539 RepID=UPI003D3057AA
MSSVNGGKPPEPPPNSTPPHVSTYMDTVSPIIGNNNIFNMKRAEKIAEYINRKSGLEPLDENQQKIGNENIPKQLIDRYSMSDTGPYQIYVENNSDDFRGRINAVKVGDIILSNFPEVDNKIISLDSIGRNRIRIKMKDYKSANYLIEQKNSPSLKNNNLELYIPRFIVVRQGVIRDIDTVFSEEYIKNKIKPFDMHCNFQVENVRRMNKKITKDNKTEYVATKLCIITFRSQVLPKYISINRVRIEVEPYIQKVLLCYNCFRYGHLGKQCKSKPRCIQCGEQHSSSDCQNSNPDPKCFNCGGSHLSTNMKICPEFKRQKQIKQAMSNLNINYHDACQKVPKSSYASILNNPNQQVNSTLQPNTSHQRSVIEQSFTPNQLQNAQQTPHLHKSHKLHEQGTPAKRLRPSSPDPIYEAHKNIIQPISTHNEEGGILKKPAYLRNTNQNSSNIEEIPNLTNIILELVTHVINIMKTSNNFDIHESDLVNIISKQLNVNVSSNSQPQ